MYLFPLGYATIAADRRDEEEQVLQELRARLREEESLERQRERDRRQKEVLAKEFREKELKRLDPGRDPENPLSELGKSVLAELRREKNSFGNYSKLRENWTLNPRTRHDVGRAMALAEMGFGLLDPISSNMTYDVFDRFSEGSALPKFQVKGRDYSWKELKQVYIGNYFNPGRQRLSEETLPTSRMDLLIDCESLSLKLSVLKAGGLQWALRGASLLKPNHRKVLGELNEILEDYELRLKWLAEYRAGSFVPGYSKDEVHSIRDAIDHFNGHKLPQMDWLKPGVIVADDFTRLKTNNTRVYPIRCTECQRVSRVEAFWPQSYTKVSWKRGKGIYRTSTIEDTISDRISKLHAATGCSGRYGIDSRSGEKVSN